MMKKRVIVIASIAMLAGATWWLYGTQSFDQSGNNGSKTPAPYKNRPFSGSRITAFASHPIGLMTGDTQGLVRVWSTEKKRVIQEWFAHDGPIRALFTKNDLVGTVGADGSVARWSGSARITGRVRLPNYGLNDAVVLNDESLIVAGERGIVARIAQKPIWRMPSIHGRAAFGVSADLTFERAASVGSDGILRIWAVKAGRELAYWTVDSTIATSSAMRF